jgi:uncharacterized membrane protein YqaE (UPF0057 family)
MMAERISIIILNILLPPVAVLLLTGPGIDFLINCVFFLLAVIPSHIHGMYISFTYYHRRSKVLKGKLPGKHRGGISSERVQRGGASKEELQAIAASLNAR